MIVSSKFEGFTGCQVVRVKAVVEFAHSGVKRAYTFSDHNALNAWLYDSYQRGKCRVVQLLIDYSYED